jgi:hypothetical protein
VIDADPIAAAKALIASGHAHQAALDLRRRLADGRGGALARVTLVEALLASKDVAGALAEAREAVSLNPDLPEVLVSLGEALLAAENLPAAIAELQRALRAAPGHDRARYLTGLAWLEAGRGLRIQSAEVMTAPAISPAWPGSRPARRTRRWRFSALWMRKPRPAWRRPPPAPKRSSARRAPTPAMCDISSINSPPIMIRACWGSSVMPRRPSWPNWPIW